MFRLMGHVLPEEKSIWIALTTVYGIGRVRSRKILDKVGVNYLSKVSATLVRSFLISKC